MKKIYISQPMRGRATGDIIAERKRLMADADAVIFAPDWRDARGCRVEHFAASQYAIPILYGR